MESRLLVVCHGGICIPLYSFSTGSYDNTAILWSVESGGKVHGPLTYHRDWVCQQEYSASVIE